MWDWNSQWGSEGLENLLPVLFWFNGILFFICWQQLLCNPHGWRDGLWFWSFAPTDCKFSLILSDVIAIYNAHPHLHDSHVTTPTLVSWLITSLRLRSARISPQMCWLHDTLNLTLMTNAVISSAVNDFSHQSRGLGHALIPRMSCTFCV